MNKSTNIHRDCTEYCKSTIHGDLITSAITKRSISDIELCSYLNYICTNCESARDSFGRTALHLAASCGRIDLVRWLLKIRNSNCDLRDEESGYTALHRSLFYGKINVAVEMIKFGANTYLYDMDSLTPLEHVTKDGELPVEQFGSLYTWGLNTNNSLGSFSSRVTPECLDIFHKRYPKARVQKVCIDKFHSLIVTTEGEVYSCGHGLEGRLGLGTEQTVVVPTQIDFHSAEKVFISKTNIGRDHCLLLTSDHTLYSCGSNKHRVLGLSPPPEKVLIPQKVKQLFSKDIEGISAARYHSVAWTVTMLFTWGLNGGQLGHDPMNGNYVINPKQVKVINIAEGSSIKHVASSDGAIGVATDKGDIYILHEYQCRKIASRLLDIAFISIIGGKLNNTLDKDLKLEPARELKVVVRTNVGNLLLWQESDQHLCRCIFSIPRTFIVRHAMININEILFVTDFGEAYRAVIIPRKKKTALEKKNEFLKFLLKEECITLKLTRIPRIHRAISIVSDPRGEDFCVIQQNPYSRNLFQDNSPECEMKKHLATLLEEANEDDNIHDVRFKIGNRVFPSHRYILAHKSHTLQGICQEEEVTLKDVNADFFEQMLIFMYTGWCDLLQVGECPNLFKNYCRSHVSENGEIIVENMKQEKKKKSLQNPIRMLQEVSKKFGCTELYKILGSYDMRGFVIERKTSIAPDYTPVYQIKGFPEYYDVILKCSDNYEIKAHKCILAARMEYFNSMFSVRWSSVERSISVPYPSNLVEALLEFVYTDSATYLSKKDCDFILKLLVIADEYLLDQLKKHCSFLLLTLTYLDLKNAVEILQFAHYYKANSLKQGAMKYIVNNMGYFLETQALNDLTDDILNDLTAAYFDQRKQICYRVITPYSSAVSDEVITEISVRYPVNADLPEDKKSDKSSSKYPKRRIRTSRNAALECGVNKCFDKRSENLDSLIQFPDALDTPESLPRKDLSSGTQKRLSAISSAIETLESEDCKPNFVNLNDSFNSNEFPLLNSPPEKNFHGFNSPPSSGRSWNRHEGRHGIAKLSQKERKKLASESKEAVQLTPESPKNPWKILSPEVTSPITSPCSGSAFSDILSNERKQKENFFKMTNKLLIHTQLEDKAILELEKFYGIDKIEDEIINIQRVAIGHIASPVWVPRNQGNSSHS